MITAIEPKVDINGRYSSGEAASLLGIHRNTLHRLNQSGLIKNGWRRGVSRKFYHGREILRFWRAYA